MSQTVCEPISPFVFHVFSSSIQGIRTCRARNLTSVIPISPNLSQSHDKFTVLVPDEPIQELHEDNAKWWSSGFCFSWDVVHHILGINWYTKVHTNSHHKRKSTKQRQHLASTGMAQDVFRVGLGWGSEKNKYHLQVAKRITLPSFSISITIGISLHSLSLSSSLSLLWNP